MGDPTNLTKALPSSLTLSNLTTSLPTSLAIGDLSNLTDALALNASEAAKYYVVDYSTGKVAHNATLYADIFITCLVFFVLLLTLSVVVVQCQRTPRIPHEEYLLMSVGPVPGTVTLVKPAHQPRPSYGTYPPPAPPPPTPPQNRYSKSPFGSINLQPNGPSSIHVVRPTTPSRTKSVNASADSSPTTVGNLASKNVTWVPVANSNVGNIEESKTELNSLGNMWPVNAGASDGDGYNTEDETFHETNQMYWTAKETEQLNSAVNGSKSTSTTNSSDTDGCSNGEEVFFDVAVMSELAKPFNSKKDLMN